MAVLVRYKPLGWTPLQVLDAIRDELPEFSLSKMVYAGRLDPMARGVMVVLTDEDRFDLDEYLGVGKSYKAEVLFGLRSDSLDSLGVVVDGDGFCCDGFALEDFRDVVEAGLLGLVGGFEYEMPVYSAYKVKGKPLHFWAREGRLGEIDIPRRVMEVFGAKLVGLRRVDGADLLSSVSDGVGLVDGEFCQEEVLESWVSVLGDGSGEYFIADVEFDVASGVYIRTLCDVLGNRLGCGGLLLGLERTRVGEFSLKDCI